MGINLLLTLILASPLLSDQLPILCENTRRRRLQLVASGKYDVCLVADSHLWITVEPVDGSGESFAFNNCNDDITSYAQVFSLNEGFDDVARVTSLLPEKHCIFEDVDGSVIQTAIQLASEEYPGVYDLVLRNCATRVLNALQEMSQSLSGEDYVPDTGLIDYLTTQLTSNGIGALAKSNPETVTLLFGDEANANRDSRSETDYVVAVIDRTIAQFQTCGNGVVDGLVEDCDDGPNNGAEGSECTKFCSYKSAWYCPENSLLSDSPFSCVNDNAFCGTECAKANCEAGSEFSGPGSFDSSTMTCSFEPCPWLTGAVRVNETHCVSGESEEVCAGSCHRTRCIRGGGYINTPPGFYECVDDGILSIEACFEDAVANWVDPPYWCVNVDCQGIPYFTYNQGAFGTKIDECGASWRPPCGEQCHRQLCLDAGGEFPNLNFGENPYTCYLPAKDLTCKLETDKKDCENTEGCQWCSTGKFCRNERLDCPTKDVCSGCDDVSVDIKASRSEEDDTFSYEMKIKDQLCGFPGLISGMLVDDVDMMSLAEIETKKNDIKISLTGMDFGTSQPYKLLQIDFGAPESCSVYWPLETSEDICYAKAKKMSKEEKAKKGDKRNRLRALKGKCKK